MLLTKYTGINAIEIPAKSEDPPPRPNLVKKARPKSGKTLAIDELSIDLGKDRRSKTMDVPEEVVTRQDRTNVIRV